jgi:hypothetical protein
MKKIAALLAVTLAGTTLFGGVTASGATNRAHARSTCRLPGFGPGASYHPHIDPRHFGPKVNNPWFPLRPGTTYIYSGIKDGARAIDIFAPSHKTRIIDGVRTRVVNDRLLLNGVLSERTLDYYAQDRCGNVWYFGEDTADLDKFGHVISRDGSFRAGVHGAQPGVFMQAHPKLGRKFRQEWSPGNAEDQFAAISKHATAKVPYGTFHGALRTKETTALEPGVLDNKLYVRGVGEVLEVTLKGGDEKLALVDVLH